jgi:phage tail sheath protein FI
MNHPSGRNWGATSATAFDGTEQDGQAAGQDALVLDLRGGNVATPSTGDLQDAYSLFANKEIVDISLVLTGGHAAAVVTHVIDNVALARLDCVVFLSPPLAAVYNNAGSEAADVVEYRQDDINRNTSYAVMDSGWKRQYDRYNDEYINVPLNADTAGLCARTDQTNDAWWSPAGFNRGQLKNIVKLVWSPNQTERDTLYKNGVNPVATFPGEGTLLYGDKTLLAKPSAFDRINVRRLFIVLEKAIATAAKYQLFEFNDVFSRAQFRSMVEPFLRDVRGRRGIFDFRVVCDETNNTGEVIDRNEFVADIYIKPARSINFIYLNFVAVRTSVSFTEVGA